MLEPGWKSMLLTGITAVALFAVATASFVNLGWFQRVPSHVTLINGATETIGGARMTLSRGDSKITFGPLEPGERQSVDFISREGSLTLTVIFKSGRIVSAEKVGYVADGIPVNVVFRATNDKVALIGIVERRGGSYVKR